jgi:hypothetical protein
MVKKKCAETPRRIWRSRLMKHIFPITIIVLLFLMLLSCARGGGTPILDNQEGGLFDSGMMSPAVDTGTEAAAPYCGDQKIDVERNEQCDGPELGGANCATLLGPGADGELRCNEDCTYDQEMCFSIPVAGGGDPVAGGYGGP